MRKPEAFRDRVLEQLRPLGSVTCRAMFGGHGLYCGERFFAILFRGRLYFRTDATTRPEYEAMGSRPFRPSVRQTLHAYYEIPADVIEDGPRLVAMARAAVATR